VRKSVKKIAAIKREVDEVERRISREEALESMKNDPKERLRVNETLMSLLFRLDSVRGVDSGVRDCRKSVIKRAIALQEFLDSIVADEQTLGGVDEAPDSSEIGEKQGKVSESEVEVSGADCNLSANCDEYEKIQVAESMSNLSEPKETLKSAADLVCNCNLSANCDGLESENHVDFDESEKIQVAESMSNLSEPNETLKSAADLVGNCNLSSNNDGLESENRVDFDESEKIQAAESNETLNQSVETQSELGSTGNPESLVEENSLKKEVEEEGTEIVEAERKEGNEKEEDCCFGGREDSKRSRELLEKIMEDNKKMMGLMIELFQRNETQTKLLSSLSQRVGQLEKAFMCDKLRKMKKKGAAKTIVDGLEKSSDAKKSEKR